jgi:hypothetical protein
VEVVNAPADRATHGALAATELIEKVVSTWTIKPTQAKDEAGGHLTIEHGALTLDKAIRGGITPSDGGLVDLARLSIDTGRAGQYQMASAATSGPGGDACWPLGIGGAITIITTTSSAEGVDHGVRMRLEGLVTTG